MASPATRPAFDAWRWRKVALDKTGIGSMPAEMIEDALGRQRVEQVAFGEATKEILATTLYGATAERRYTIPDHVVGSAALRKAIGKIKRVVHENGRVSYEAPRSKAEGHADHAWALALALYAAGQRGTQPPRQDYGRGDFRRGNA